MLSICLYFQCSFSIFLWKHPAVDWICYFSVRLVFLGSTGLPMDSFVCSHDDSKQTSSWLFHSKQWPQRQTLLFANSINQSLIVVSSPYGMSRCSSGAAHKWYSSWNCLLDWFGTCSIGTSEPAYASLAKVVPVLRALMFWAMKKRCSLGCR